MATHTVTLDIPEALYQQLSQRSELLERSLEEELVALLTTNRAVAISSTNASTIYDEIVDFLGRGPSAKEIIEFTLSSAAQNKAQKLLAKNKKGVLSPAEEAELDAYVELENFMALLKIRAQQQLQLYK